MEDQCRAAGMMGIGILAAQHWIPMLFERD
jgi:hypothetical protein